jgi:hypothetical protein
MRRDILRTFLAVVFLAADLRGGKPSYYYIYATCFSALFLVTTLTADRVSGYDSNSTRPVVFDCPTPYLN